MRSETFVGHLYSLVNRRFGRAEVANPGEAVMLPPLVVDAV